MYLYCYARVDVLVPSYRQISIFPKQLEGIDFPHGYEMGRSHAWTCLIFPKQLEDIDLQFADEKRIVRLLERVMASVEEQSW